MKTTMHVIIGVLLSVALIFALIYGVGYLKRSTADFRGETDKIEQTEASGNYRIDAYEMFYNKCAGVMTLESKIMNLEEELALTGEEDTQRISVLKSSITASKNKRAELINAYNADASKDYTVAQFKASDLPYKLNEEGATICGN